jgi:hypothetical protein
MSKLTKERAEELGVVFEEIRLREETSNGQHGVSYPVLQATVTAGGSSVTYQTPIKGAATRPGRTAAETHEDILLRQVHDVLVQRGVLGEDELTNEGEQS